MTREFLLFGGSATQQLAADVARELGAELGRCSIERFPDGEVAVRIEEPVRRREVFIVQSTAPPVDQHLVELLCFADAARRAAADRITAIIPYFGYSRADKRHARGEAIAAGMVGEVLQAAGVDHVLTVDLHAPQIEGFFRIPVDSLSAVPSLAAALDLEARDVVVCAPDEGRVRMATRYGERLDAPVVVLHKHRESGTVTTVTRIVGDVKDRRCIVIDDMIATGGTLVKAVDALLDAGARTPITIAATHGLFVGNARERLDRPEIDNILVSDSVATPHEDWARLRVVSIAPLIASALHDFVRDGSLTPYHPT